MTTDTSFWHTLMELVYNNSIILDRPKGTAHPRYPSLIYPLNYGYLDHTSAGDADGIDVGGIQPGQNTNRNLMHV